jgi:hypothetical protein
MAATGYLQEKDRAGSMMKQKVRFILKKKGKRTSSDAPKTNGYGVRGSNRSAYPSRLMNDHQKQPTWRASGKP